MQTQKEKPHPQVLHPATWLQSYCPFGHMASSVQWKCKSSPTWPHLMVAAILKLQPLEQLGILKISQEIATGPLVRSFCNQLSVPEPGLVTCKCFDPKTSKIIDEDVAIFYPHLMFSALAESYPEVFQRLFKLHELPEFWEQTLARDDDRLVNHPATLEKGWEQVTILLFTHGDGVEYESRDSLMVWSFGPLPLPRTIPGQPLAHDSPCNKLSGTGLPFDPCKRVLVIAKRNQPFAKGD